MTAPEVSTPRSTVRMIAAVMAWLCAWGAVRAATSGFPVADASGVVLLGGAFVLALGSGAGAAGRMRAAGAGTAAFAGIAVIMAGHGGRLEFSDAWTTPAVGCVALLLIWRGRPVGAWSMMAGTILLMLVLGGLAQLEDIGALTTVLSIGIVAAAGHVLTWYAQRMRHYADTEREALEWRVAQDAYQLAHQQRIEQTGTLADAMLRRIVEGDGRLDAADRQECRLLHQAIRDETRGRLLLNDALREQVMRHRRRGAVVQLLDDGRLDALAPDVLAALQDDIAARIAPLGSDRIVIRSRTRQEQQVVTVVATTLDPVASALGQDDDEQIDLWHEFAPEAVPARVDAS